MPSRQPKALCVGNQVCESISQGGVDSAPPGPLAVSPMDQNAHARLVANLHLPRRRMARGQPPDRRRAHPRLLAGVERVRRRARLRGRDARSRQALRPSQSLGPVDVPQADDERRGDGRARDGGGEEIQRPGPNSISARCTGPNGAAPRARWRRTRTRPASASASTRRRCPRRPACRSPAPPTPSRSPSPCRSTPRPAASIPTTGGP